MFFETERGKRGKRGTMRPSITCKYCDQTTHEWKAECVDHLGKRPYVAALLSKLARHEKESAAITKKGDRAVKLNGLHAQEILAEVRTSGPITQRELVSATKFPDAVVRACLRKMEAAKMLKICQEGRERFVVALV
jgi:ribosomal protein S25